MDPGDGNLGVLGHVRPKKIVTSERARPDDGLGKGPLKHCDKT
jgi:hypothetical protein